MNKLLAKLRTFSKKKPNLIIEIALIALFVFLTVLRLEGVISGSPETELPKNAQAYLKQADQSYESQALSNAVLNYWYALKKNPDLVKPHVRIGKIFYNNYWNKEAMIQIERALEKEQNSSQAHLVKGRLLRNEGLVEKAAEEFEKALEIEPDNPEARHRLGLAYQAMQLSEPAIEQYKLAIDADQNLTEPIFAEEPFGLQARLRLAIVYQRRDLTKFNETINLLIKAYNSGQPSPKIRQASIELLQTFDEPIELLEEIYEEKPSYTSAKQALIDLLYKKATLLKRIPNLRQYGGTLKLYERIVEIEPTEADAWKQIGSINFYYTEDYERALEAYSKAYKINPNDRDALANVKHLKLLLEQRKE